LLASFTVSYRIFKCEKRYAIGQSIVLPAAIDIVETVLGEWKIPLEDSTVGIRIWDISGDLYDQLTDKLKNSRVLHCK
jgi:hypothetical protein